MFENHIIQIIIDGVKQKEHGNALNVIRIQLDLNLRTDFNSMPLEDLAKIHENIVKAEKDIQVIDNFCKFYRGLLYQTAHNKCEETQFLKWIKKQDVSKATVYRYMSFAALIMRLPGLILCDLNFSQLLKHKERILAFMGKEINSKLAHQLSDPVEFRVGTMRIEINATDSDVPHIKGVTFPPEWKILDRYDEDSDLSGITQIPTQGATNIVDETVETLENFLCDSELL